MISSSRIEGLFYVNESVRNIYEETTKGRTNPDALEVYGLATVEEYVKTVAEIEDRRQRQFLVFDQTAEFIKSMSILAKNNSGLVPVLIPEHSLVVPGVIDLVPKPFMRSVDLAVIGELPVVRRYKSL